MYVRTICVVFNIVYIRSESDPARYKVLRLFHKMTVWYIGDGDATNLCDVYMFLLFVRQRMRCFIIPDKIVVSYVQQDQILLFSGCWLQLQHQTNSHCVHEHQHANLPSTSHCQPTPTTLFGTTSARRIMASTFLCYLLCNSGRRIHNNMETKYHETGWIQFAQIIMFSILFY